MATTTYGTPYVQSSDLVSAYPGTSSTLATRIDDISLKGNGVNAQTASYTLVLGDGGKTVTMTNAGATTLTVPTNASVAFPTGVAIVALNLGAGTMTVAGAGGVTVNGTSLAVAQYEAVTLRKTDTNTWVAVKGGGLGKASVTATTGSPTVTTVSGKTCYKFTGTGSITVGSAGTCDVLVIGGAGGGGINNGGGGGAGGMVYRTNLYMEVQTHTVTVGAGGGAYLPGNPSAVNGIVGYGGGRGGYGGNINYDYDNDGGSGGSGGGGASYGTSAPSNAGAAGVALLGQGNNGGSSSSSNTTFAGAGGGGAGGAATNASNNTTSGGAGLANSITGSSVTYAAGGTGGSGSAGAANTGDGGARGFGGGSGVVIILIG